MIERVRAVLLTPSDGLLLIRRTRPGGTPYWVLPGGHVEPADAGLLAALVREVREEVGSEPEIAGLVHVIADERQRQHFYVARIRSWSEADRTGPEFDDPDRGEYRLEEIPSTVEALDAIDLRPEEIACLLRDAVGWDRLRRAGEVGQCRTARRMTNFGLEATVSQFPNRRFSFTW